METKRSLVPGANASPIGARMSDANTCRSEPSGENDTIDAEYPSVGVHVSHGAEMPT